MRGSLGGRGVGEPVAVAICDILAPVGGRIVKKLRTSGLRGTLAALLARLRRALYSEEVLIVMRKDLDRIVATKRPTGVVVEPLSRQHLPLLIQLNRERGSPEVDERFGAYFDAGFNGFIAQLDGATIGYYWWVDASNGAEFPDLRDFGMGIELGPGEVYGSDFYILEAHRNGRLASEVLSQIETGLSARGYSRLWGYVLADNRPARWLYETRGYERLWLHARKRRFFMTKLSNTPDPRTAKGGPDVEG